MGSEGSRSAERTWIVGPDDAGNLPSAEQLAGAMLEASGILNRCGGVLQILCARAAFETAQDGVVYKPVKYIFRWYSFAPAVAPPPEGMDEESVLAGPEANGAGPVEEPAAATE